MTELYLNGFKMALKQGETIATTIQANDLAKPDTVQSSFTNTFQIVATAETRKALGFPDEVESNTDLPYQILDAQLIADGREILPFGLAEIVGSEKPYFEINVYSGNISFFDALGDKILKDLDLNEFNHSWTFDNVSANTANTKNFIYDLVHQGKWMDLNAVNWQDLMPSVFGKLLFDKIIEQAGFTYTGLNSEFLDRLLLPATFHVQYPDDFLETISTYAGTTAGKRTKIAEFEERAFFDSDSVLGYKDGDANCYDAPNELYTAKYPCIVNVEARLMASIGCTYGTMGFRLSIYKNGFELAYDYKEFKWSFGGDTDQPLGTIYQCSANNVYLNTGDTLEVRVKFTDETTLTSATGQRCVIPYRTNFPEAQIYNEGQDYFKITPLKTFPAGGLMKLNYFLPDMKQSEFIKFCLQLHNGVFQSEQYSNNIKINEFRSIEKNTANALDWSEKFVSEKGLNYKFGDFSQVNWIKYKEDSTIKKGYGDGSILCGNKNLQKETSIIEMPFSASNPSSIYLPLTEIPFYSMNGVAYQFQKIEPRILLQGTEKINYILTYAVPSGLLEMGKTYKVLNYDKVVYNGHDYLNGQTFVASGGVYSYDGYGIGHVLDLTYSNQITAPLSYFERQGQTPSLNFQNYIIPNYYSSLSGILNKLKYLKCMMRLNTSDIVKYDATIPVWIEHYGHYFYVNKISEFQAGKLTEVELIRL